MIERIVFAQQIAVPGTPMRTEYFNAPEWEIAVEDAQVRLSRPANPEQNIKAIRPFVVVGVGFSVQEFEEKHEEQAEEQGSAPGDEEAAAAHVAGGAPEDTAPAVDAVPHARRRLRKARRSLEGK